MVPFTDGKRAYNVVANLEKTYKSEGEELIRAYEKSIMLAHIDDAWKEHLREMDDFLTIRAECNLRAERPVIDL